MTTATAIAALRRNRPEWGPWLDVVAEVVREGTSTQWEAIVPHDVRTETPPLLSGVSVAIDEAAVRRLLERLVGVASRNGSSKMRSLTSWNLADVDLAALFRASVRQDYRELGRAAADREVDPEVLQAIVALLSMPFLQAANRRLAIAVPRHWVAGYCPICAAWPAFAEVRGIDRSRYLRCARCGAEWHARLLHCAFCDTSEHDQLASLVPETQGSAGTIDACRRCHGYLKVFTRLKGAAPETVVLDDLASVDLDLAAVSEGCSRPQGNGCRIDIAVNTRKLFAWNS